MAITEDNKNIKRNQVIGDYRRSLEGLNSYEYDSGLYINKSGGMYKLDELKCVRDVLEADDPTGEFSVTDDSDGSHVLLTLARVKTLILNMQKYGVYGNVTLKAKLAAIATATTQEQLDAITFE